MQRYYQLVHALEIIMFNEMLSFLIFFVSFFPQSKPDPMKGKICELIQCWSHAFRNEPNYKVVQDTFNLMKMEGKVVWRFVAIKMIQIFRYALLITDTMCNLILKYFFFEYLILK